MTNVGGPLSLGIDVGTSSLKALLLDAALDENVGADWASQTMQRPDPAGRDAFEASFLTYEALCPALRPVWSHG